MTYNSGDAFESNGNHPNAAKLPLPPKKIAKEIATVTATSVVAAGLVWLAIVGTIEFFELDKKHDEKYRRICIETNFETKIPCYQFFPYISDSFIN